MELLELAQLAPALVDRHIVVVRFLVQGSPTHQAEALAVRLAERRERRRPGQLLPKERSQGDLEGAADGLLQQRRYIDLHFALPSGCYRTRGSCPCGSARRSSRTSRLFLMTDSVFTRSLSSRTRTSAAY